MDKVTNSLLRFYTYCTVVGDNEFTTNVWATGPLMFPSCIYAESTHMYTEVMKTNKCPIWCKAVSQRQANKHAALISSAIRQPWCIFHGRRSAYCSSLITLHNKPLPTLTQMWVCSFSVSDGWQLLIFRPLKWIFHVFHTTWHSFRRVSCGS